MSVEMHFPANTFSPLGFTNQYNSRNTDSIATQVISWQFLPMSIFTTKGIMRNIVKFALMLYAHVLPVMIKPRSAMRKGRAI